MRGAGGMYKVALLPPVRRVVFGGSSERRFHPARLSTRTTTSRRDGPFSVVVRGGQEAEGEMEAAAGQGRVKRVVEVWREVACEQEQAQGHSSPAAASPPATRELCATCSLLFCLLLAIDASHDSPIQDLFGPDDLSIVLGVGQAQSNMVYRPEAGFDGCGGDADADAGHVKARMLGANRPNLGHRLMQGPELIGRDLHRWPSHSFGFLRDCPHHSC
ncbi:uncharacterized protein MYCFIDRAFT_207355 [Pseudocercospora fijiensis CIRAD86]|uniref:Uncharacterized protein n=1 Tax=Pseudocercospora fijiensis (strain CIRAD86) TaxID=383855 RepID=M3B5M1_PSEFD|nr:uncharacterized protein MYCFIDRAFT_207355 [Pseudocercospora fijiensis CIRAD86]EME84657.1 hypothetical protein MYCFIDRAFT_207355 [Pseudocercospora fijiensis CIRAD86]